jgi:hypothetical protein
LSSFTSIERYIVEGLRDFEVLTNFDGGTAKHEKAAGSGGFLMFSFSALAAGCQSRPGVCSESRP